MVSLIAKIEYVIINSNWLQEIMAGQKKKLRYLEETPWFPKYHIGWIGIGNSDQDTSSKFLLKYLDILVLGVHHIYLKTLSGHIPDFVKSFGEFMVYKEFARWSREDCEFVLRDFQDFPDRLVSKNVAPQHAWPRNENERSGQLIAITAKLAARVPTFPTPIAIYRGSPTYKIITITVSTTTVFGLCTCKWGILR